MANTIKIKRSAVSGKVPTTGDLQLGELAVNTFDGKLYTKKDNGTVTIVEIGASAAGVSSFSAGTTGLTPSGATTGAITLAGTLAVANGGTGVTTGTGSGSVVLSTSPTLVTPILGTPTSGTLTNCTGYTWANIASKPTTISGFGLTDAFSTSGGSVSGNITMTGNGAIQVASGTTAQRPTGVVGMVRYNTSVGAIETYVQGAWQVITPNALDYGLITTASDTTFDYGSLV